MWITVILRLCKFISYLSQRCINKLEGRYTWPGSTPNWNRWLATATKQACYILWLACLYTARTESGWCVSPVDNFHLPKGSDQQLKPLSYMYMMQWNLTVTLDQPCSTSGQLAECGQKVMLFGQMYPFNRKKVETHFALAVNTGFSILTTLKFQSQHPMTETPV